MIGEDIENIEVETIEKMTPDVKLIYLKIREQLQDSHHPLMIICKKFQNQFTKQIDREYGQLTSAQSKPMRGLDVSWFSEDDNNTSGRISNMSNIDR